MGKVIVITSGKGGVGKTTTAVNLGAALAHLGRKTLVVDLDPQGNATSGVGLDKNALAQSRREINRELARAERMLAEGGYIPGCDHLIPPNVPWANWKYYVEELRKLAGA